MAQENGESCQERRQIITQSWLPCQLELLRNHRFNLIITIAEMVVVVIAPVVPTRAQYVILFPIVFHALWTAVLGNTWIHIAKSVCQIVGVALSFWRLEAFIVVFHLSILSDTATREWLNYHRPAAHLEEYKIKITFLGIEGVGRTDLLLRLIGSRVKNDNRFPVYKHPERSDIGLFDIPPFNTEVPYEYRYLTQTVLSKSTAVVMIYDPRNRDSFKYIEGLGKTIKRMLEENKLPNEQPGMLVSNKVTDQEGIVTEKEARDLGCQYGWLFTQGNEAEVFNDLLCKVDKLHTRLLSGSEVLGTMRSHNSV
ncbi:hypothetical protein F4810DRAFT_190376 [Camillea tinctor]|nr:hypothetical protein F4810DRAFT_190376 [Camillea tinctor]